MHTDTARTRGSLETLVSGLDSLRIVAGVEALSDAGSVRNADIVMSTGLADEDIAKLFDRCVAESIGIILVDYQSPVSPLFAAHDFEQLDEVPGVGLLEWDASPAEIEAVCTTVALGYSTGSPSRLSAFYGVDVPENATRLGYGDITPRETEVLNLVADGFSNGEIAGYLSISENTVKYHLSRIMSKFGAANRTEAVLRGIQAGALDT